MKFKFVIILFLVIIQLGCHKEKTINKKSLIIPKPNELRMDRGYFTLDTNTSLVLDDAFKVSGKFVREYIENGSDITLKEGKGTNSIIFLKDTSIENEEAYVLEVAKESITIKASTDKGAFYAVQSLRQLLPSSFEKGSFGKSKVQIPCLIIKDHPRFAYRGMHLDVGRHMFPVAFIKKYIDALAMLKMNTFHWHLTEDQGWRIEIKKYPKLNEVAAYRNETLIGHYNDQPHQFDGKKYGGFYTQEQVKEIVSYAAERQITVIPEIEMPGHSQAAIAAYPKLGCTEKQVAVATKWGVFEEIYCTKEETFTFLEDVLDEVLTLFPSTYIHIGGDEAPKTRWKACKHCQKRIKEEGLKDEHELQSYFITRIEKYLNAKGRKIIGWDEILEGGLAPNAAVMSWRGTKGAIEAAKQNHPVVLTPTSHCYFDYYQAENDDEPLAIGGYLPLQKVYDFDPVPEELTVEQRKYVLGGQGNVWTEYMPTKEQVEYMVFPRILAMSEVLWTQPENKNYRDFISNVEFFNERLDDLAINYTNHLYQVEGKLQSDQNKLSYSLQTGTQGKEIRYTLDGSIPTKNSKLYTEPIPITKSAIIKAAVFKENTVLGKVFTQRLNYHKAVGKKIDLSVMPHKAYNAGGKEALVNSISGSNKRFGDSEWLGFWGDDVEITVDLGEITEINSISTRFHNGKGQWIYSPREIGISFDDNAYKNYKITDSNELIQNINVKFGNLKTRKIKIKIPSYGLIPVGSQGSGNMAWTFIDELTIN